MQIKSRIEGRVAHSFDALSIKHERLVIEEAAAGSKKRNLISM
jgi:hypothetical protein